MADNVEQTAEPAGDLPAPAPAADVPTESPVAEFKPPGQTSRLTKVLVIFNLLTAVGFGLLLFMDVQKRQEWSRAIFLRDLVLVGLPVDDRDLGSNPEAGAQTKYLLDSALLKDAYKARGGTLTDRFIPVYENFKVHISVADLDEAALAAQFSGAGKPVSTLAAEVKRVKEAVPSRIDDVATETAAKSEKQTAAEKRVLLRKLLFPMCREGTELVKVENRIESTPDAKLSEMLTAAVQRRMLFDLLLPLEIFRPTAAAGDSEKGPDPKAMPSLAERAADLDTVSVDDLKALWRKRCDDCLASHDWFNSAIARNNPEKRRCVAYLLVAISQLEVPGEDRTPRPGAPKDNKQNPADQAKPDEGKDKEPDAKQKSPDMAPRVLAIAGGERRAEAVSGLRDFNQACEDYAVVTEYLEKQLVAAIRRDLGKFQYPIDVRIHQPKKFADELLGVMQKMKISIANEAGFRKAVESKLKDLQGRLGESDAFLNELKKIMEAQQVVIGQPDEAAAFDRAVDALLSANAIGFLEKHHWSIKRIQDLALLVQRHEDEYAKWKTTFAERDKQLKDRLKFEGDPDSGVIQKLELARAKTRELARLLSEKQQELFLAQAYLARALDYNLYLAERLAEVERAKARGGKGP